MWEGVIITYLFACTALFPPQKSPQVCINVEKKTKPE